MNNISIVKLQNFIEEKGFVIKTIYHSDNIVQFVKIVSIHLAEIFILTIPNKYGIKMRPELDPIAESVEFFDVTLNSSLSISNSNPLIDSQIDSDLREDYKKDMIVNNSKSYHRSYDRKINIDNNNPCFSHALRLLNRLCYSVIDIPYELAILNNTCLVITNKEKKDGYIIQNELKDTLNFQMFICFTIEVFYKSDIINNAKHIYTCIYKLLDENSILSFKKINNLNPVYRSYQEPIKSLITKKNTFLSAITKLQALITNIKKSQLQDEEKLRELNLKMQSGHSSSLQSDEYHTFEKQKIHDNLEKLEKIQLESTQSILDLRLKVNNIVFVIDTVLFDNLIMLTNIKDNFEKIKKIKRK